MSLTKYPALCTSAISVLIASSSCSVALTLLPFTCRPCSFANAAVGFLSSVNMMSYVAKCFSLTSLTSPTSTIFPS